VPGDILYFYIIQVKSQDTIVGIATGYGLDDWAVGVPSPGDLSPGVKRPRREADHSSPSAEVKKNVDLYIHSPQRLHGIVT
jgi:hypothetical protein